MMRANTSRRITKPIAIAIMLIALTLVCGLLFSAISLDGKTIAQAGMSKPSGGYNEGAFGWTNDHLADKTQQSGMTTISSTSFTANGIVNFSGADNQAKISGSYSSGGFGSNSWGYETCPAGSAVLYRPVFFHTYKLTDEVYENIAGGYATVSVSKGANLSYSNGGAFDVRVSAYLSLGTATSDENAKTYANYNEIKVQSGSMTDPAGNIDTLNTNFNNVFNNISKDLTTTSIPSGNKYLRVGVYFEIWPGSSSSTNSNLSLSNVSLNVSIAPAAPSMSLPTGNHSASGNIGYFNNGSTQQRVVQNDMQTLSLTSTPSATNFTGVDNIAWINANTNSSIANENKFNSTKNGWSTYVNSTGTMFHPGFMYTYKLTDAVYNSIKAGTIKVSLTVNGQLSLSKEDNRLFMYVGIGTSSSDNLAKTFVGFTEKAYDIDIANDGANSGYLNAAFSCVSSNGGVISKSFNNASLATNSNSEKTYKYLRVAVFFETWSDVAQTITYSNMSMDVSLEEQAPIDSTVPSYTNNMTKPSDWGNYSSTFYDSAVSSNFHQQASIFTLSNSNDDISLSGGYFNNSGKGTYYNGWGSSNVNVLDYVFAGLSTKDQEKSANTPNHYSMRCENNERHLFGMFYTVKLTTTVYNALLSGGIKINYTVNSQLRSGDYRLYTYPYVGIGYAANDTAAQQGNGFIEIKGKVGDRRDHKASNNSASQNSLTNFTFASVGSQNISGNGNDKYLRFGVWGYTYSSNEGGFECNMQSVLFDISIDPADTSSNGPSYSVSNGSVVSSNQVTISDNPGVDYYTLNGKKVQVAKISNTSFSTNTIVTLPEYGTYTLSAVDLWGNSSSSITFDYFYASVVGQANTDGVLGNYDGGKIVFNANYSNGNGYQSQEITNSGAYNSNFNIWAKPNDGYYFAGFTLGDHYSSINLNLASNNTLSSAESKTGSNGNYPNIKADTHEYMFSWNAYTNLIIPGDGKIYITANFKAIPTTNNSGTYDKSAKTVVVGAVSSASGTGGTVRSVINYSGTASGSTAPVNVGTYPTTTTITWNLINVGTKTENVVITPKDITATYNLSQNNVNYFAGTDVTSFVGYAFGANDICSGDTVGATLTGTLSDKNAGARTVAVSATLNGTSSNNYNLTNPTGTLNMTVNTAPVSVTFTTTGKVYDGTTTATVNAPTITGIMAGESISYDLTANYGDKNVGEGKAVTLASTNAIAGANTDLNNYSITTNASSLTANITPAPLTINYTLTTSKTYDGNNVAEVTNVSVADYMGDDNLRLAPSVTATYTDVNVSENATINVVITLGGTEKDNYSYVSSKTESGKIKVRELTITANDLSKTYGESDPTLTYSVSAPGFVTAGDELNANITLERAGDDSYKEGGYVISVSCQKPSDNYYLNVATGTFTINKRATTVTLTDGQNSVYGDAIAVNQTAYSATNVVGEDDLGVTITKAAGIEVGTYDLTASATNVNYSYTFVPSEYEITKRDLTINLNSQGSVYGDSIVVSNSEFATVNLVDGDVVVLVITKEDGQNADNYTLSGALDTTSEHYAKINNNYNVTINGNDYVVSPRPVAITIKPQGSEYGEAIVVSNTEYVATNVIGEEDLGITITKKEGNNAGDYELTYAWSNTNYAVTGDNGVYTINKAKLTVKYAGETITYGATPAGPVTYEGWKNGEGVANLDTQAVVDFSGVDKTGDYFTAGEYTNLKPSGAIGNNYYFEYEEGKLTINKAPLTIKYVEEIVYGGTPNTNITASEFTVSGLLDGDNVSVIGVTATLPVNAGTYENVGDYFTFTATNYEVTSISEESSFVIAKAPLDIKVTAPSGKNYGDLIELTVAYGSALKPFVNGEDEDDLTSKVIIDLSKIANDNGYVNAGAYDLVATGVVTKATSSNYDITHTVDTLNVSQKTLTIVYDGESKVYDGKLPTPNVDNVTVTGMVDREDYDYIKNTLGFSFSLTASSASKDVGEYSVYASNVVELLNYRTTFNDSAFGVYEITKATLTATYESETITFGGTPVGNVVLSGFAEGDDEEVVTVKPTANFASITATTIIGENTYINASDVPYEVAVIGGEAKNYNFNYVSGNLTVNQKEATITVKAGQGSVYGKEVKVNQGAGYYEVEGLIEGDSISVTLEKLGEDVMVGDYTLTAVYVAPNYKVTVNDDKYSITKATLEVAISYNNASVLDIDVEGLLEGDFTVSYAGFVYEDDANDLDVPVKVDLVNLIDTLKEGPATYDILYTLGEDDQYIFNYSEIGQIIVVASLKDVDYSGLSFVNSTVEYDGNAHSIEVSGSVLPSEVEIQITYEYTKPGRINAGIYGVTASIKVLTAGYRNEIPNMTATLKIEPRKVDITLLPQGSLYGEAIEVSQTKYNVDSNNVVGEDDLGVTITKSDVMNANHGEYDLSVVISNENYVLNNVTGAVYTIAKRNVTITLQDQQGEYGLTAIVSSVPANYVLSGDALVSDSDLSLTINVESADVYEVGKTYDLSADVAENEWYNFTVVDAKYSVKAKAIEITLANKTAVYGDIVDATTTFSFTKGGLVRPTDNLALVFSVTDCDKYVVGGNYDITAEASNANYEVTVVGAKYVIGKKELKLKVADQTSTYGDNYTLANDFEVIEGLVSGDSKEDLGAQVKLLNGSLNAGSYILTLEATNGNYEYVVTTGTYLIEKATTYLYLENYATTFTYTGEAINLNRTADSYVYTNRPDSQANIKYPTDVIINAGSYTVVVSINESTNFLGASEDVIITVEKAIPVANFNVLLSKTYVYNGSEQTIKVEDSEIISKADLGEVVVSWSNNTFTTVPESGKQEVVVSFSGTTNYVAQEFKQVVDIHKAKYDFTGVSHEFSSKEVAYNGEKHSVEVSGLPSGITVEYSFDGVVQEAPFSFKDAGTYIVQAIYTYDNVNYYEPTELIKSAYVKINRIDITVKVVNQHGYYGDAPEFDPSGVEIIAGSFVFGDEIDLDLQLEPKESYPIGIYKLVASTTSSGNYNITVAAGTYEIIPRPITVTVDDKEGQYGDEDLPLTFKVTEGALIGEDTLKATLTRQEGRTPGEYIISGSVVNPNYAVTIISGKYTITPRKITIEVFNQEGTSASALSKRAYKTFGKILKGDNLNIQVVGEIGTTPGEYAITASYNDNPNYEIVVKPGIFTLMKAAKINVKNPIYTKLYDGVPYVFDVEVSSGATPVFSIGGIYVENAFTEVGVYELDITAGKMGEFAEPDTYRITFEIRPTELATEKDGIHFIVSTEEGFGATETLEVEYDVGIGLSGGDYTSKVNAAFTLYIVNGEERTSLEEYMQGKEVHVKIKLSEELTEMGAETWFMDGGSNVLHEVEAPDENGYIEVNLTTGQHVVFVTAREEAAPLLIVAGGMGIIFLCMAFFFLFRKKFIN